MINMGLKSLWTTENRKKILNLFYSIGAVVFFNMIIQFVIYPFFERKLGSDHYGVALSVISLLAITAGACGYSVGCARLLGVEKKYTANSDYNLILLAMGFLCSLIGVAYLAQLGIASFTNIFLYVILILTTMLRYYSEVEFRIKTNFLQYMIYYVLVSVGYTLGLFAFHASGQWMLALISGEALALLYVCICGTIYRPPFFKKSQNFPLVFSSVGFLLISALIDNITLHADRILLLAITGDGSAVTVYYIASLVGKVIAMLTGPLNALIISYLVRYQGGLTKKFWLMIVGAAVLFGAVAFIGCIIVSPWLIGILYPDNLAEVKDYLVPAILGQIFYFVSGVLMIILLRFKGEKKQFIFNSAYAVEFFVFVIIGTVLGGLGGFVLSILLANAIRMIAVCLWGFLGNGAKQKQHTSVK